MSRNLVYGKYEEDVMQLANSMTIHESPNQDGMIISFSTGNQISEIQGIRIYRETTYAVPAYPRLQLHLTEVQDLVVQQDQERAGNFIGVIEPQSTMMAKHRLWWEASISSKAANHILKQNEDLQWGQTAQWQPSDVVQSDLVHDLFNLSEEIVTRIDHIGLQNQGPVQSASKNTARKTELTEGTQSDAQILG